MTTMSNLLKMITASLVFLCISFHLHADWLIDEVCVSEYFRVNTYDNPLVITADNTYHLVYKQEMPSWDKQATGRDENEGVFYQYKVCGEAWSQAEKISPASHDPNNVNILSDENGQLYITYMNRISHSDREFIISTKTANGWEYESINKDFYGDNNLIPAMGPGGNLHLVWVTKDEENQRSLVYAFKSDEEWQIQEIPETYPRPTAHPSLELSPDGKIHVLYNALGEDNERNVSYLSGQASGDTISWNHKDFHFENHNINRSFLQVINNEVNIVLSKEDLSNDAPRAIEHYKKVNDEWSVPLQVNHVSSGEPLSLDADHDGNLFVSYREIPPYGDFGVMLISEMNGEDFDDYYFDQTLDMLAANNSICFDEEGNQIHVYNEGYGATDLYVLRSGECTPPSYTVSFDVADEYGQSLPDATITLDSQQNDPGDYTFNGLESGEYYYVVEKQGYITLEDELTVDNDDVLHEIVLEENDVGAGIVIDKKTRVFPNPASHELRIHSNHVIHEVRLISPAGQLRLNDFPMEKEIQLDVSRFQRGYYVLQVITRQGADTFKVHLL